MVDFRGGQGTENHVLGEAAEQFRCLVPLAVHGVSAGGGLVACRAAELVDQFVTDVVDQSPRDEAAGNDRPGAHVGHPLVDQMLGRPEGEVDGERVDQRARTEGKDVGDELVAGLEGQPEPGADHDRGHRDGSEEGCDGDASWGEYVLDGLGRMFYERLCCISTRRYGKKCEHSLGMWVGLG